MYNVGMQEPDSGKDDHIWLVRMRDPQVFHMVRAVDLIVADLLTIERKLDCLSAL